MNFASDNWAGASAPVMAALQRHNVGFSPAYGGDDLTKSIEKRFQDIFETDCKVWMVATGTAANALALSTTTGPAGAVLCHTDAHIRVDECGAPEFLTSGARMWGIEGRHGKLTPQSIDQAMEFFPKGVVHHGMASALSLSQATEVGTAYSVSEIEALSEKARLYDLAVHMDGARFANALVTQNATPAEMTWKAGVDILSFGATKNGAWCAEAVIFFNEKYGADFGYRRKRAGHLFSKMRFSAAQFDGYLSNDHWLGNARHANAMAKRLSDGIKALPTSSLAWDSHSNEVFAFVPKKLAEACLDKGAMFHEWPTHNLDPQDWPKDDQALIRLVCSFATTEQEVDQFLAVLNG